jgi:hypothetical protein
MELEVCRYSVWSKMVVRGHKASAVVGQDARCGFLDGFVIRFFGPKIIHSKYKIAFFALIVGSKEMS